MATAKLNTLIVESAIAPFKTTLGKSFDKIVNDIKAMLGRVQDKDVLVKHSDWKASARFALTSRDGYKIQLPLNNPAAQLLCFGMRCNELAGNGEFEINATIPKNCQAWIDQHVKLPDVEKSEVLTR